MTAVKFSMHLVFCELLITVPLDRSTASHPQSTQAQDAELCCLVITLKQIHC